MRSEDRLRGAFEDRALEVQTSPQAIFEINRRINASRERGGFRLQFRPSYVLAGAACALLAAVGLLSVMQEDPQPSEIGVFDNTEPDPTAEAETPEASATSGDADSPETSDAVETTPDATSSPATGGSADTPARPGATGETTTVGLPSPERARVAWPTTETPASAWPASPDAAAAGFVSNYLGLSADALEPAATNGSTGSAVLNSPTTGSPASTLELAAFDVGDDHPRWAVVAARSTMLAIDDLEVGGELANPAVITGSGEGVSGAILANLYDASGSPAAGDSIARAAGTAGNLGTPEPFELELGYPANSESAAVLVLSNDGTLGGITVIPVTTSAPITPCEPEGSAPGAVTVAVYFPCEASESGDLIERVHTASLGSGLLGALQTLAAGPTDAEVDAGLYSALPTDPDVISSVAGADGWAVVDLTAAVESSNGPLVLEQLNSTAFALAGIVAVEYRIDGDCERFAAAVGAGGCRIYTPAGDFQPPTNLEPRVLLAASNAPLTIFVAPSFSSEAVATLATDGAGEFRLTGATVEAEGTTWVEIVATDASLGWLDTTNISVQPLDFNDHRQLMIDRANDLVAVGTSGDLSRIALSDKALWTALVTDLPYMTYLPAEGLTEISAWTAARDLGTDDYPLGSSLAEIFAAETIDVIWVNETAAVGAEPPAALSGLGFVSLITTQELTAEPTEEEILPEDQEAEPPAEETPDDPEILAVVLNVYFDFSTGEPRIVALSAHPLIPAE
jgi:hypothetical protein